MILLLGGDIVSYYQGLTGNLSTDRRDRGRAYLLRKSYPCHNVFPSDFLKLRTIHRQRSHRPIRRRIEPDRRTLQF